jgi:excisionase family DNA binding protein
LRRPWISAEEDEGPGGIGWWPYDRTMLTVVEPTQRAGRSTSTVRRWIRSRPLSAAMAGGRWLIDPDALEELRGRVSPMLELPSDWRRLADGTPSPKWVALSRIGR